MTRPPYYRICLLQDSPAARGAPTEGHGRASSFGRPTPHPAPPPSLPFRSALPATHSWQTPTNEVALGSAGWGVARRGQAGLRWAAWARRGLHTDGPSGSSSQWVSQGRGLAEGEYRSRAMRAGLLFALRTADHRRPIGSRSKMYDCRSQRLENRSRFRGHALVVAWQIFHDLSQYHVPSVKRSQRLLFF